MIETVNVLWFGESLAVGAVGFVVGCAAPIGFRLIGAMFDTVRKFVR